MELRLWSDLYLIQGRYIVIMGTPNKTSSLFVLNGLDVYPSLYGSSRIETNDWKIARHSTVEITPRAIYQVCFNK